MKASSFYKISHSSYGNFRAIQKQAEDDKTRLGIPAGRDGPDAEESFI
jgi:hypothetical protein